MTDEELKPHIRQVLDDLDMEVAYEKQWQFLRLDKCDKYNRGLQYIAPTENATGTWEYTSVGVPLASREGEEDTEGLGIYDYNINVLETYGRRWTAVLGQRPFWALKAVADDPQSEDDRKAARQWELAKAWLHANWKVETQNIRMAQNQWRAGTPWIYTPYAADRETFGTSTEPVMAEEEVPFGEGGYDCIGCGTFSPELATDEMTDQTVCPGCGHPIDPNAYHPPEMVPIQVEVDQEEYDNGGAHFYICNGFTVTVPFGAESHGKRIPWLLYEFEDRRGTLYSLYPELRDLVDDKGEISAHSGDTNLHDASTRSSRESLIGERRVDTNRWTHARWWLHADTLQTVDDEAARKHLLRKYPDGVRVTEVEGEILMKRLEGEAVNEVWQPVLPYANDFLVTDPVSFSILGHQDAINDCINNGIEHIERGLPTTIVESGVLDVDAINERRMLPQEIVETSGTVSGTLDSKVKTLPTARFPPQIMVIIEFMEKAIQAQTGLNPAVFGQLSEGRKTAEEYRLSLNQALQQLGPPGEYLKLGWIGATTNGVKQLIKYAPRDTMRVSVTQGGETVSEMLDFEAMRNGNCHFEAVHAGVPQTFADERDSVQRLITENPEMAAMMGTNQPSNIDPMKDYWGLQRLKTPLADIRQRTLGIIQRLMDDGRRGAGPTEAPMPDGSVMLLPSIAPRDFIDDHAVMAQLAREWLNDDPEQKKELDNPQGYSNVVAYGKAQELAAQAKLMMGQPPPEEAAPGEKPAPMERPKEGSMGSGPEQPGAPPPEGANPEGNPIQPATVQPQAVQ